MSLIFQISISGNTKCENLVSFCKLHIPNVLIVHDISVINEISEKDFVTAETLKYIISL